MNESDLIRRLESLEKSNRRLQACMKIAIGLVVAGIAAGLVTGEEAEKNSPLKAVTFECIRAREFRLVNEKDQVVSRFQTIGDTGAMLSIGRSAEGKACVNINAEDTRASISVGTPGSGVFLDSIGKGGGALSIQREGGGSLSFMTAGGPTITAYDAAKKPRIDMTIVRGVPSVTLLDDAMKPRIELTIFKGTPSVTLLDEKQPRLTLGRTELEVKRDGTKEETPESAVTLFDKQGNVVMKLPR